MAVYIFDCKSTILFWYFQRIVLKKHDFVENSAVIQYVKEQFLNDALR